MSTDKIKKAPSLQHLVRMIRPTAEETAKAISAPPPRVRVFEANHYVKAVLSGMSADQALASAEKDPRQNIRKTALEVIPLIAEYMAEFDIRWFKPIESTLHQISPSIQIPIKPLGIVRTGDRVVVVWPQLWKTISLTPDQYNIFASYLKFGHLDKSMDFDDFHWLELSVPKGKKTRELRVRTLETAQLLTLDDMAALETRIETAVKLADAEPKPERNKKPKDKDQGDFGF